MSLVDTSWVQADYAVLSSLFSSISDDVLDVTMEPGQHARNLWVAVEGSFCNNKEPLAIYISTQFHMLLQGDMSISAYYQRMKQLADSLRDVGHPVSDPQLILNLLHRLAPRLSNQTEILARKDPFPSFTSARTSLLLAGMRTTHTTIIATNTTLMASTPTLACSVGGCAQAPTGAFSGSSKQRDGKNHRGKH